ncbi:MAG: peptide/nickel transport system permease protein/oligopeptide transport system permease protein [Verrucomicrobiales bacterium]|nr:peptide/nickel transport system permease protein/oligopeptide transport system permease protein [Verrucomicrobiales bacterium]
MNNSPVTGTIAPVPASRQGKPSLLVGASYSFLILLFLASLLLPLILPHAANETSANQFSAPSASYWFGTDAHGRDLLSRTLIGTRVSLVVALVGGAITLLIGVSWGVISGYAGGKVDAVMMRTVDILYTLPSIILVLILITTAESLVKRALTPTQYGSLGTVIHFCLLLLGVGIVSWLTMARIIRGQVLGLRSRSYVEAASVMGASRWRILRVHILPNIRNLVVTYFILSLPGIVLTESFLSYLGLGIQPPQASLGSLMSEGALQINPIQIYWWLLVFPGTILVFSLLSLTFAGEHLKERFDPMRNKSI